MVLRASAEPGDGTNMQTRLQKKQKLDQQKPSVNMAPNVPLPSRDQAFAVLESHLQVIPNKTQYNHYRDELTEGEFEGGGWDATARKTASDKELKAAHITRTIREHERDNLFGNKASEAIPGPETLDMGGQFLTNKERIEKKSRVYKIAHRMPKGAHLHLHFNAEIPPERLIVKARDMPNMFIRSTQPILTQKDFDDTELVVNIMPIDTTTVDIFSPDYKPEFRAPGSTPWMRWSTFQESFVKKYEALDKIPQSEVPMTPAERWIKKKMVLSESEAYAIDQTTNGIWARFNQATRCFKGFMNYEMVFRWYIGAAIDSMIEDGVMYAELRPMLLDKSIPADDGVSKLFHRDQMKIIREEYEKKRKQLEAEGRLRQFPFCLKIIYCTPRSIPKKMMQQELRDCIQLKLEFPDLVCGFDLVGAEDRPNSINYYRDELLAFAKTCEDLNLDIPFMFHAGETLLDSGGSKDPKESNLYEAVLLKAKRIGHGYALTKHPLLVEQFRKQDICIELCPTSNELLHLCRNIKEHPYPEILALGIPCTVNSDNPSLFRYVSSFHSITHLFFFLIFDHGD